MFHTLRPNGEPLSFSFNPKSSVDLPPTPPPPPGLTEPKTPWPRHTEENTPSPQLGQKKRKRREQVASHCSCCGTKDKAQKKESEPQPAESDSLSESWRESTTKQLRELACAVGMLYQMIENRLPASPLKSGGWSRTLLENSDSSSSQSPNQDLFMQTSEEPLRHLDIPRFPLSMDHIDLSNV